MDFWHPEELQQQDEPAERGRFLAVFARAVVVFGLLFLFISWWGAWAG